MSIELCLELKTALLEIARDNACWVVILTGAGRAFCSGLDLKDYGIVPDIAGLTAPRIAPDPAPDPSGNPPGKPPDRTG